MLPATREYFYPHKRCLFGVASFCRTCANAATHESRKKHDPTFTRVYAWRAKNPGGHARNEKAHRDRWTPERRQRHNAWAKGWLAERRKDGRWRVIFAMRAQLVLILRNVMPGDGKRGLLRRLGYSRDALIQHLESQFQPGMSWANYGRAPGRVSWEVDHIKPVTAFDHADPEQFKVCWGLQNLRPLWAAENRAKGASVA